MNQDKRVVIGMDLDSAEEAIPKTMARRVENCRVNIVNDGKDGIVEPFKGNIEVVNDQLPGFFDAISNVFIKNGTNKTIGTLSDTTKNRVFYFNWNSENIDQIFYFDGNVFVKLVEGDLGWEEDLDIHSIVLINNLLTWVEGDSKYPREINVNENLSNPKEFDLSLIKTPPTFPLQINIQNTGVISTNFYKKGDYYFIYRFGYDGGQQSSWSPYSKLVSSKYDTFNIDDPTSVQFKINELRVFRAAGIDGLGYNTKIKYIDFAYANTYTGPFKLFKRTKVDEVLSSSGWDTLILSDNDLSGYGQNKDLTVEFRNDLSFSVIADTDTSRPYDEVWPAESIVASDNRVVLGNTLEGFDGFDLEIGNVSQGKRFVQSFSESGGRSDAESIGNFMVWKNNSKYEIGIVFYNEFGQKSGVYTDQRLAVLVPPDYRTDNSANLWSFNFDIGGMPPEWATHYQIVRTNNNKVVRFIQGLTNDVLYVSSYDANGNPVVIPKTIGFTRYNRVTTEVKVLSYIQSAPPVTIYRRSEVVLLGSGNGGGIVPNQSVIGEYGVINGIPAVVRVSYWTGRNTGELVDSFFYPDKAPYEYASWTATPDANIFSGYHPYGGGYNEEPLYEEDYVIGYIPKDLSWMPPFNTDGFSTASSTPNAQYRLFALGIFGDPIYVGGVNRRGEKVDIFTKKGLDQAVDILIDIYNWNNNTTFEENKFNSANLVAKNSFNPSCETPYVFQANDRLNIYYSMNGTYVGILDLEIKDFIKGRYLKIKFDKRLLDGDIVGGGAFIETSTPNTGSDDIFFFEFGECYPINNPKTSNRSYSKTSFNIFEGDTHYMIYSELYATDVRVNYRESGVSSLFPIKGQGYYVYPFFSMSPDNLNRAGLWEKANGRPNVILLDGERQTRRKNTIRYSDRYIDGATINGTSTFYSFNSIQLDYGWGAIRKLTSQEEIILVNCEQEAALVYVNKAMLSNASGADTLVISDKVLNSPKKLPGGYGCTNPESVNQYDQYIYFYSKQKATALRYNVFNGLFDISGSYKARSYFYNKKTERCYTGFDPKFRTQYFKFDDENIGFIDPPSQDHPNTWSTFVSFLPDKFAYIQLQLYTFLEGKLYKHEEGPINTFYGVKYPSRINVIFNQEPNFQKIANFISQETDKALWCEIITNQEGQLTTIEDGAFEKINKDFQCDIPGDITSGLSKWEGNLISSHLFNVTFRYDGDSLFRLRYLNLYSQSNERTNK